MLIVSSGASVAFLVSLQEVRTGNGVYDAAIKRKYLDHGHILLSSSKVAASREDIFVVNITVISLVTAWAGTHGAFKTLGNRRSFHRVVCIENSIKTL